MYDELFMSWKNQICAFRHITAKLPSRLGLKQSLTRIKIHVQTSTQTCASYVVVTLKGGSNLSQGVISPVCTDMPAACLGSSSWPLNVSVWTKRKTHLDRVGSANTLTWGCRTQHSSTGCKVAGAVWRPVKQQWQRGQEESPALSTNEWLEPAACPLSLSVGAQNSPDMRAM